MHIFNKLLQTFFLAKRDLIVVGDFLDFIFILKSLRWLYSVNKYILLLIMWNLHAADSCAKGRQICVCYPFITPYSMYILLYVEMFTKDRFHNP